MCGRFAFFSPAEAVSRAFGISGDLQLSARFNITPGQQLLSIRHAAHDADSIAGNVKRVADWFRWGLVPFWAKDPAIGNRMINARAETVAEKPSYRQALRRRRCLIPADGFYEWQKTESGKQPWFISSAEGVPLAFAGLWEEWQGEAERLRTCTIITTAANSFMHDLHHRMPVVIPQSEFAAWLDPAASNDDLQQLMADAAQAEFQAWPVSRRVNNPVNDDLQLIEAVTPQ